MNGYSAFLSVCALIGALCAGFILAQSARRRATQLVTLLVLGASWWALCDARVSIADSVETARFWMRLGTPGWAFIGGLLPHVTARYFDAYPSREMGRLQALSMAAARVGYGAGLAIVLAAIFLPQGVHTDIHRVPWGWSHVPGPIELAFFAVAIPCATLIFPVTYKGFRCSVAVAPRIQRISMYVGTGIPALMIGVTEVSLPIAGVAFPRFGAVSYTLFGLIVVVAVLRYGLSFFTPHRFSDEILDRLHEGVVMLTPTGRIRRVNRSFVRLCGMPVEQLVSMPAAPLFDEVVEPDREVVDQPARLRTRDGDAIAVSLSTVPLTDNQSNPMGLVIVVRDMREIQGLRRQIVTQARLAAVGELAAGLAHELNNPLAFIRANLGLLEKHVETLRRPPGPEDAAGEERSVVADEAVELVCESLEGVARMSHVVQGVRRFTESGRLKRETADLNALLEDTLGMARLQSRGEALEIEFSPGELPGVRCAAQDLRQAILNVLMNAAEAMGRRGRIHVSTRVEEGGVVVLVEDDGPGMAPEEVARIFDPFYTTKSIGEGTGLGLTIAWHIVEAHDGRIDVDSAPGEGTTVAIHLPA